MKLIRQFVVTFSIKVTIQFEFQLNTMVEKKMEYTKYVLLFVLPVYPNRNANIDRYVVSASLASKSPKSFSVL